MKRRAFAPYLFSKKFIERFHEAFKKYIHAKRTGPQPDEESNQPSSSVDTNEKRKNRSGEDTSAIGPLLAPSSANAVSDLPIIDEDEDMDNIEEGEDTKVVTTKVQPKRRAYFIWNYQEDKSEVESTEESSSDEEILLEKASSKAKQARSQKGSKTQHPLEVVTYAELEAKVESIMVKKVLDYYHDPKQNGYVLLCGLYLDRKCEYKVKHIRKMLDHMHGVSGLSVVKVIDYPVKKRDSSIQEYIFKCY